MVHKSILIFSTLVMCQFSDLVAKEITFTTFNIRFYGSKPTAERDKAVREFVKFEIGRSDVIAFQEIVDKKRFEKKVKPSGYQCHSYDHERKKHLHVLICVRSGLRLDKVPGENNYIIEEVALSRYRPAVYGVLKEKGEELAIIGAVHLKAQPEKSSTRMEQVKVLSETLVELETSLPIIVTGDYNTHGNDISQMTRRMDKSGLDLRHLKIPEKYTYRTLEMANQLDHYWLSPEVEVVAEPDVLGPCNLELKSRSEKQRLERYNDLVSDHCPVKATFDL